MPSNTEQTPKNTRFNGELLMSDAENFDVKDLINPFMHAGTVIDHAAARAEHNTIRDAMRDAGAEVQQVPSPANCQDGVYTANWALCINGTALMANLPYARRGEVEHAGAFLEQRGFTLNWAARDAGVLFSGQGGALLIPGTNIVIVENGYRTDPRMNDIIAKTFNVRVVPIEGIPERNFFGKHNLHVGWRHTVTEANGNKLPQSPVYDVDLDVGILGEKCIAYAPSLMNRASRQRIEALEGIEKIVVNRSEALNAYACNLVAIQGEDGVYRIIVNQYATELIKAINDHDNMIAVPTANDILKFGGGGFRCSTLTLNNRAL